MKYTKFRDIPAFTQCGSYSVNVGWGFLEDTLKTWDNPPDTPMEMDPDFQRAHVWTLDKQSRFVEYVLRGGRSSRTVFWNCPSWHGGKDRPIQLVDGKQRLEAVRKFLRGELPIFGGSVFSDFTDQLRITGGDFVFVVNDLQTRAEVLQWYLDLNDGGVVHTESELAKVRALLAAETSSPK